MAGEPMALPAVTCFERTGLTPRAPLSELPIGDIGVIVSLEMEKGIRDRLIDIGFTPGATVRVLRRSMLGDPTAFLIRGAVIALRSEEAAGIFVERVFFP